MAVLSQAMKVGVQLEFILQRDVEAIARTERLTVSQVISTLVEEGLLSRQGGGAGDGASSKEIAPVAAGGAFDWLTDEPDIYDDSCGESIQ